MSQQNLNTRKMIRNKSLSWTGQCCSQGRQPGGDAERVSISILYWEVFTFLLSRLDVSFTNIIFTINYVKQTEKLCCFYTLTAPSWRSPQCRMMQNLQMTSAKLNFTAGGCVIPFYNQWNLQNQESCESDEKIICFGFRAGLVQYILHYKVKESL